MSRATETFHGKNTSSPLARKFSRSCLIWASLASCAEMARALVLHLLLAGAAAMPTHGTSEVDDPIAGPLRDRADASDHATSHSHDPHPIDEEVADAHDQHALTPPGGDGARHVHRSARGQSRPARRASSRAKLGQTPRHLQLERSRDCGDVTIWDANDQTWAGASVQHGSRRWADCTTIHDLTVRTRPRPTPPALG